VVIIKEVQDGAGAETDDAAELGALFTFTLIELVAGMVMLRLFATLSTCLSLAVPTEHAGMVANSNSMDSPDTPATQVRTGSDANS
jgi:hypothetical protein